MLVLTIQWQSWAEKLTVTANGDLDMRNKVRGEFGLMLIHTVIGIISLDRFSLGNHTANRSRLFLVCISKSGQDFPYSKHIPSSLRIPNRYDILLRYLAIRQMIGWIHIILSPNIFYKRDGGRLRQVQPYFLFLIAIVYLGVPTVPKKTEFPY